MKQISLLLFIWLSGSFTLFAQWNINLGAMHVHTRSIGDLHWQNGRILMAKGSYIFEFELNEGICTGFVDRQQLPKLLRHSLFIRDISNDPASNRLFLTGLSSYGINGSQAYTLAVYQPGEGYIQQMHFSDSLIHPKNGGPTMLETGNRKYWILGANLYDRFPSLLQTPYSSIGKSHYLWLSETM
ncbi:MAG: hypothetical protein IT261_14260 [Saprospiraceae bacterium]|nr:hypothetical protein [Saprospiraceae bacterium]